MIKNKVMEGKRLNSKNNFINEKKLSGVTKLPSSGTQGSIKIFPFEEM